MSRIRFRCTECESKLSAPDHAAGYQIACPICKSQQVIPPTSTIAPNENSAYQEKLERINAIQKKLEVLQTTAGGSADIGDGAGWVDELKLRAEMQRLTHELKYEKIDEDNDSSKTIRIPAPDMQSFEQLEKELENVKEEAERKAQAYSEVSNRMAGLREEQKILEQDRDDLKRKFNQELSDREALQNKLATLETEKTRLAGDLNKIQEENAQLRTDFGIFRKNATDHEALLQETESLKRQLAEQPPAPAEDNRSQAEIGRLTAALEEVQEQFKSLQLEKGQLESGLSEQEALLKQKNERLAVLEQEQAGVSRDAAGLTDQINELQQQLSVLQKDIEHKEQELEKTRSTAREDTTQLTDRVIQAEANLARSEALLKEKEGRIEILEQEHAGASQDSNALSHQVHELKEELIGLRTQLQHKQHELDSTRKELEARLNDTGSKHDELEKRFQELEQQHQQAQGAVDRLTGDLKQAENAHAETLAAAAAEAAKRQEDMEQEITGLHTALEKQEKALKDEGSQRDGLKEELETALKEVDCMNVVVEEMQVDLENAQKNIREREDALAKAHSETQSVQSRLAELESTAGQSGAKLSETEKTLAEARQHIEDQAREHTRLKEEWETEVNRLQKEKEEPDQETLTLREKVSRLESKLVEFDHAAAHHEEDVDKWLCGLQQEVEELENKLSEAEQDKASRGKTESELAAGLAELQKERDTLQKKLQQAEAGLKERDALQKLLQEAEAGLEERDALQKQLQQAEAELNEHDALQKQLQEAEAGLQESDALKKQLQDVEAELAERDERIASIVASRDNLEQDTGATSEKLKKLEDELAARKANDAANAKILQALRDSSDAEIEMLQGQIEQLKKDKLQAEEQDGADGPDVNVLLEEKSNLEETLKSREEQIATLTMENKNLAVSGSSNIPAEVAELTNQLRTMKQDLTAKKQELTMELMARNTFNEEIKKLKEQLATRSEGGNTKGAGAQATADAKRLRDQVKELERVLKFKDRKLTELNRVIDGLHVQGSFNGGYADTVPAELEKMRRELYYLKTKLGLNPDQTAAIPPEYSDTHSLNPKNNPNRIVGKKKKVDVDPI